MIPFKSLSALFGVLVVFCLRCCSTSVPDVSCYVVNLEKVNCSWNCVENFNFSYKFGSGSFSGCTVYTYADVCRAGCIFPMEMPSMRFSALSTILSNGNTQRTQTHELKNAVKLNPPQNVTVRWSNSTGDVRLLWALGRPIKQSCVETRVSFRRGEEPWQDSTSSTNSYQLKVSQTKRYQFRVQHRYSNNCGESRFWSDWSETVSWGPVKPPQEPDNSMKSKQTKDLRGLYVPIGLVGVFIILVVLTRLLLDCERIRVILVPVAPDPAKKLNDLFLEYSGNVEGWVRISPQLRDAFDPDYTESTCEVTGDDPTACVVDE